MNHTRFATVTAVVFLSTLLSVSASAADLESFLGEIDLRASADLGAFRAELNACFDVSSGEVDGLFEIFTRPADIYITLRIGELSGIPTDRVVNEYRNNKSHGWGVIAKNLGIKPGSAEFHALKDGRLSARTEGDPSNNPGKSKGKSSGKRKGRE